MSKSSSEHPHRNLGVAVVDHIGVTVSDIEAATQWYQDILGFERVGNISYASSDSPYSRFRQGVFGERWSQMRQARLVASNGVGLELFQFDVPATVSLDDNFTYWMVGPHHLSVKVDDTAAMVERVIRSGGRLRGEMGSVGPAHVAYCEDPWGNMLELCDRFFRELAATLNEITPD